MLGLEALKLRERPRHFPRPGDQAPTLALPGLDGSLHDLDDWRGRTVLIVFWAPWSTLSVKQVEAVRRLSAPPSAVVVDVAVDLVDRADIPSGLPGGPVPGGAARFHLIGHRRDLAPWGDLPELPATVLIGADGVVRRAWTGFVEPATLQAAMR